jgi:5-methylcytosine-specific restriction endonuclease McrA
MLDFWIGEFNLGNQRGKPFKHYLWKQFTKEGQAEHAWHHRSPKTMKTRRLAAEATREMALDILGHKCIRCGITDGRLLDIDHIKPLLREPVVISKWGKPRIANGKSWITLRIVNGTEDLSNLQLLCCNCHRLKTLTDGSWEGEYTR